jgi:hypothetical protein
LSVATVGSVTCHSPTVATDALLLKEAQ